MKRNASDEQAYAPPDPRQIARLAPEHDNLQAALRRAD